MRRALIAGSCRAFRGSFRDIGVPRLEVDAASAFALAALVDGGHTRIQCPEPGDDAV